MEQKTISINPSLFTMSKPKKEKKEKKNIPLKISTENNFKKELINKIKKHQKTKKNKSFSDNFDNSLSYLKNIINEIKEEKTEKEPVIHSNLPDILSNTSPLESSNNYISSDNVPWGNLKNGSKPTYRTWMKQTRKNNTNDLTVDENMLKSESYKIPEISQTNEILIREPNHIQDNKKDYCRKNKQIKKRNKRFIKKSIKRKYNCGKNKTKKQIFVLIKDIDSKNKIIEETNLLAKVPIKEVKKYLYDRSFIKVGSTAPDTIIRKMYESCILSGNVKNENSENLIHNYFNS